MNGVKFNPSEIDDERLIGALRKTLIEMNIPFEDKPGGIAFSKGLDAETYSFETLLLGFDDILSKNTWIYNSGMKNTPSQANLHQTAFTIISNSAKGLSQSFSGLHITRVKAA